MGCLGLIKAIGVSYSSMSRHALGQHVGLSSTESLLIPFDRDLVWYECAAYFPIHSRIKTRRRIQGANDTRALWHFTLVDGLTAREQFLLITKYYLREG